MKTKTFTKELMPGSCHSRIVAGSPEEYLLKALRKIHKTRGNYSFVDRDETYDAIKDRNARAYVRSCINDSDTGVFDRLRMGNIIEISDDFEFRVHPEHWMELEQPSPFYVDGKNVFYSATPLDLIRKDLIWNEKTELWETRHLHGFFVNQAGKFLKISLTIKSQNSNLFISDESSDLPKLDFDQMVNFGEGCGGDTIQHVLDFKKNIIYIVGSGIEGSLGLKEGLILI